MTQNRVCHVTWLVLSGGFSEYEHFEMQSKWTKRTACLRTRCQNIYMMPDEITSESSRIMKLRQVDIKINCNILKPIAKPVNNTSQFQFWKYLLPQRSPLFWASIYLQMLLKLCETETDIGKGNCEECWFDFIKSVLQEWRWARMLLPCFGGSYSLDMLWINGVSSVSHSVFYSEKIIFPNR